MRTENGNSVRLMFNVHRSHSTCFAFLKVEADDTLCRGILLKTAVATTPARLGLIGLNGNVANLATGAKRTGYQLAVGNHAGTNARTNSNQHKRRHPNRNSRPCFTKSRRVGVIDKGNRGIGERRTDGLHQTFRIDLNIGEKPDGTIIGHRTRNIQSTRYDIFRLASARRNDCFKRVADNTISFR